MRKEEIKTNSSSTRKFVIICLVSIVIITIISCISIFMAKPETQFNFSMDICSESGMTSHLFVNVQLIDNGIDPIHYRGTVSVGKVEYIDHISRFYSNNTSFFERISERWRGISYNNFYFPKSGSFEDYIEMTYLYDEQKNLYIRIRHIDPNDSSMVDYFGPCNSGESAELIKEKFDTYALSGGKN